MALEQFRNKLKSYLRSIEKSQEHLAFEIGLDPATLSNKLTARRGSLTRREIKEIAQTLINWQAIKSSGQIQDFLRTLDENVNLFSPVERTSWSFVAEMPAASEISSTVRKNLEAAQAVPYFYGRTIELAELRNWVLKDHCQVLVVLGLGGIGKTSLVVKLLEQVETAFISIKWCSLRDTPTFEDWLDECNYFLLADYGEKRPISIEARQNLLLGTLKQQRHLLVLDNLEAIMTGQPDPHSQYLPGYEAYGSFLQRLRHQALQSCVMLTSRELPQELVSPDEEQAAIRTLTLRGLDQNASALLLSKAKVQGSPQAQNRLNELYAGNPLQLKIIAGHIRNLFDKDINRFLQDGVTVFGDITRLLNGQFLRLSDLEKNVMYWLAIEREAVSLLALWHKLYPPIAKEELFEALDHIQRRSLLEIGRDTPGFTLQPAVMEFLTQQIIQQVCQEIISTSPRLLVKLALTSPSRRADGEEPVQSEMSKRLWLEPIIRRLWASVETEQKIGQMLAQCLSMVKQKPGSEQGYALENLQWLNASWHFAKSS